MMNSIKRMLLTGAAVMLMMSFAAPAMAMDLTDYIDPNATYTDYISSSFDPSIYYSPDIGTAGDRIPVEAGGSPPPGPVVVGPAPTQIDPCWQQQDGVWNYVCPTGSPPHGY
jgi:hypothetical protein